MKPTALLIALAFPLAACDEPKSAAKPPPAQPAAASPHQQRAALIAPWVERLDAEAARITDPKKRTYAARLAIAMHAAYGRSERATALLDSLDASERPGAMATIAVGRAETDFDAAMAAAAAIQDPKARAGAYCGIAFVCRREGQIDRGLKALEAAPPDFSRDMSYGGIAEWHAARGQFDLARAALRKADDASAVGEAARKVDAAELLQAGPDNLADRARAAGFDLQKLGHALAAAAGEKAKAGDHASALKIATQIPDPNPRTLALIHTAEAQAKAGDHAACRKTLDLAHQAAPRVDDTYRELAIRAVYSAEAEFGDADRALRFEREKNEAIAKANAALPPDFDPMLKQVPFTSYQIAVQLRSGDFPAAIATASQGDGMFIGLVSRELAKRGRTQDIEQWLARTDNPATRVDIIFQAISGLLMGHEDSKSPATRPVQ